MEKVRNALWYARRPAYWAHATELAARKLRSGFDGAEFRRSAQDWAAQRTVSVEDALVRAGLLAPGDAVPTLPAELVQAAEEAARRSAVSMGGAGHYDLIHAAALLLGARRIVETGVAYGWSSLALLAAFEGAEGARLVSVDMPYVRAGNDPYVGIVVPERLRRQWVLIREPDRKGLEKAIDRFGGCIDFCHYDSDKSWWGRQYAYPLLWEALRPGGIFVSDDIDDNMAFASFIDGRGLDCTVTTFGDKFIGLVRKPGG